MHQSAELWCLGHLHGLIKAAGLPLTFYGLHMRQYKFQNYSKKLQLLLVIGLNVNDFNVNVSSWTFGSLVFHTHGTISDLRTTTEKLCVNVFEEQIKHINEPTLLAPRPDFGQLSS